MDEILGARQEKPLTSVLVKPAGPDCNLACRYCFYLGKAELFPGSSRHRMSDAVLEALISNALRGGASEVSFCWQGGEPTLMGLDFFRRAVALQASYRRDGQSVQNSLQTNGILIDAEWCQFLAHHRFLVGLSLDGSQQVHDALRRDQGGGDTWERVVTALRLLQRQSVDTNVLAVVNRDCVACFRETYDLFVQLGVQHMQFIPALGSHAPSAEAYGRYLCQAFDQWLAGVYGHAPRVYMRWFESLFYAYVGMVPPECTLSRECGTYLVVEHDGDVYPCDFFVESHRRLGNVLSEELVVMLNSDVQSAFGRRKSELADWCLSCRWLSLCGGGCPAERVEGLSALCEAYRVFFSHADERFRQLAAEWRRANGIPVDGAGP